MHGCSGGSIAVLRSRGYIQFLDAEPACMELSVAVGAEDDASRNLFVDSLPAPSVLPEVSQRQRLLVWVAVVEVQAGRIALATTDTCESSLHLLKPLRQLVLLPHPRLPRPIRVA